MLRVSRRLVGVFFKFPGAMKPAAARTDDQAASALSVRAIPMHWWRDDRRMFARVIHLHPQAAAKPAPGAPCNGCGVCCASEPCPLGILASGRREGRCAALVWHDGSARYRCGLVESPALHLPPVMRWAAPAVAHLARRCIAAGAGCDCTLEAEPGDLGHRLLPAGQHLHAAAGVGQRQEAEGDAHAGDAVS